MQIRPAHSHKACILLFLLVASSTVAQTKRLHPDIENIGKRDLTPRLMSVFPFTAEHENSFSKAIPRRKDGRGWKIIRHTVTKEYNAGRCGMPPPINANLGRRLLSDAPPKRGSLLWKPKGTSPVSSYSQLPSQSPQRELNIIACYLGELAKLQELFRSPILFQ